MRPTNNNNNNIGNKNTNSKSTTKSKRAAHEEVAEKAVSGAVGYTGRMRATNLNLPPQIPLAPKDFVAILSKFSDDGVPRWILGQVEAAPYQGDVDIRLWDKQREARGIDALSNPALAPLLERIKEIQEEQQKSLLHASEISTQMRMQRAAILAEIEEANMSVKASKAIMNAARADVENIPMKHWQELKSYRVAPEMVSAVLRAVMLLLGEDDARSWPEMQKVLRDINFKSRITSYVAEMRLSPERREFIIRECVSRRSFRYDRAMQGSLAIGPIYYWVLAQLDSGEAFKQKHKVDRKKIARQRELRAMLRQVHQQAAAISEHHALMDDLDDQLRALHHQTTASLQNSPSSVSRRRSSAENPTEDVGIVTGRYKDTFAGKADKTYLKPAFFDWRPTNCILTFLRKTILCNFGRMPQVEERELIEGLDELQVRLLDQAIIERLHLLQDEDEEARNARELAEERQLENQILRQEKSALTTEELSLIGEHGDKHSVSPSTAATPSTYKWETLSKVFDGDKWKGLLEKRREEVVENFTEDTANCLELPLDHVVMGFMSGTDTIPIEMTVDVLNKNMLHAATLQSLVDRYGYPKLSALCEEAKKKGKKVGPPSQLPDLLGLPTISFQGHWWEKVLEIKRNAVDQTFIVEAAEALGLTPPQHVSISSTKGGPGGLEFSYVVHQSPLTANDAVWRISSFAYPKLWALYDKVAEELERVEAAAQKKSHPPSFTKTFEGPDWHVLLRDREPQLKEAFKADESECLKLSPEQIDVRHMHTRPAGELTVEYDIIGDSRRPQELKKCSGAYDFPRMWALYEDIGFVITKHTIGFEGKGWKDVVKNQFSELKSRFVNCTVNLLGLRHDDVTNLNFSTGSLYVHFDLHHPVTLSEDAINEKLRECPYLPVWELLPLSDDDEASGSDVHHEREKTLPPIEAKSLTTIHELGFEGAGWEAVLARYPLRVKEVVVNETKKALRSFPTPQEIVASSLQYADESLVAKLDVTLPVVGDMTDPSLRDRVQVALEEGTFSGVFELLAKATDIPPPESPNKEEATATDPQTAVSDTRWTGLLERRFPGDGWERVLQEVGDSVVERAFQGDVSDILHIPPENIAVDGFRIGSLIVSYRIRNLPQGTNEEDVKQRLQDEYRFPRVQSLYKLRASQLSSRRGSTYMVGGDSLAPRGPSLTATKDFRGSNWVILVQNHLPLVQRMATRDITAARGCSESSVELQPFQILPRFSASDPCPGLRLTYDALPRNPNEKQSDFTVEASKYAFPRLEALHATPIPRNFVTNSYTVHFDAQEWAPVLQKSKQELITALSIDTSDACAIRQEDVVDVDFHTDYDALTANMCIRHDNTISRKKIEKKLFLSSFPHVWGIYARNTAMESELREFRGEDWERILKSYERDLRDAFAKDTSNALDKQIGESDVNVQEVRSSGRGCCVKYLLPNIRLRFSPTEVAQRLNNDKNYPHVWALYDRWRKRADEPRPPVSSPSVPQRLATNGIRTSNQFPGDRWKERLVHRRQAVSEAFQKDVQQALTKYSGGKAGRFEVTVFSLGADNIGLTVKHMVTEVPGYSSSEIAPGELRSISHTDPAREGVQGRDFPSSTARPNLTNAPLTEPEVQEVLSAYAYPLLWEEYYHDESSSESELEHNWSRVLQRRFEGKHWGSILQTRHQDVHDAFKKGISDSCGVPTANVDIVSAREGSLVVDYRVLNALHGDDEIHRLAEKHPFPELMNLHPPSTPRSPPSIIQRAAPSLPSPQYIRHEMDFAGPLWREVLQNQYSSLAQAFQEDTAECLGCSPAALREVDLRMEGRNGSHDLYSSIPNRSMSSMQEDDRLLASVSKSYLPRFAGDEEGPEAEKQEAYKKMKAYSFPRVWRLYPRQAVPPASPHATEPYRSGLLPSASRGTSQPRTEPVMTQHDLQFMGEEWPVVLNAVPNRVQDALVTDISRCLSLPHVQNVNVISLFCLKEKELRAAVRVSHPISVDAMHSTYPDSASFAASILSKLKAYPFPQLWSLLDITPESASCLQQFPGDRWPVVAGQRRETVSNAFRKDMSKATGLPDTYIAVQDVCSTKERGLAVTYAIRGNFYPVEKAREIASGYSFPNVWSLYNQPTGPIHQCQLTFLGKYWDYLLSINGFQASLEDAFFADIKACFPFVDTVYLRGMKASEDKGGRLDIFFTTEVPPAKYLDSRRKMGEYTYPFIWDLYANTLESAGKTRNREGSPFPSMPARSNSFINEASNVRKAASAAGEVVTRVGLTFQGPDWPVVWNRSLPDIRITLESEVSAATNISPDQISAVSMKEVHGGMEAHVAIRHFIRSIQKEEITQKLNGYPFSRVWDFYELPRDTNYMLTRTKVFFEGEKWGEIMRQRGSSIIESTFANEAEALLNLPPGNIQVVRSQTSPVGLSLWCAISNAPRSAVTNLNAKEFPQVWALYEVQRFDRELKCQFEGDWTEAMKQVDFQSVAKQAFTKDVGMGLGIPSSEVGICGFERDARGNLAVRYRFASGVPPNTDIHRALSKFFFPNMWELYLVLLERKTTSGILHRRFEGSRWSHVINNRLGEARAAFARGVSDCCGVPPNSVEILNMREGSLLVDYRISNPPGDDHLLDSRVQQHPFPELMALHPSDALSKPFSPLSNSERAELASRRLPSPKVVTPSVSSSLERREAMISSDTVVTMLTKEFLGRGWDYVLSNKRLLLEAAFQEDTALALSVPVDMVRVSAISPGMTITCAVRHPEYRKPEHLRSTLRHYPYDKVWSLYEDKDVKTLHELFFYATKWAPVMKNKQEELLYALRSSGSKACDLPMENISVARTELSPDRLAVTLEARHPRNIGNEALDQMMENYPFDEVWALLEEDDDHGTTGDVTVSSSSSGFYSPSTMVRLFPGAAWEAVTRFHHGAVRSAFIQDSSDCLHVPSKEICVLSMLTAERGLLIHFTVENMLTARREELMNTVNNAPYSRVWALYDELGEERNAAPLPSSDFQMHCIHFPGANWDLVMHDPEKRAALTKAIHNDCIKALEGLLSSSAIGEPNVRLTENEVKCPTVVAELHLRPPVSRFGSASQRSISQNSGVLPEDPNAFETYDQPLRRYPFPSVWALYPEKVKPAEEHIIPHQTREPSPLQFVPSLSSQEHKSPERMKVTPWLKKHFPGADWVYPYENLRPQLEKAFRDDTSEATKVPPANVELGEMELGSLIAEYRIHDPNGTTNDVERQMEEGLFPRVWALYRPKNVVSNDDPSTHTPQNARSTPPRRSSLASASWASSQQLLPPATRDPLLSSELRPSRAGRSLASIHQNEEQQRRTEQAAKEAEERAARLMAEHERAAEEARSASQLKAFEKEEAQRRKALALSAREQAEREAAAATERAREAARALNEAEAEEERKNREAADREKEAKRRAEEAAQRAKEAEEALREAEEAARRAKEEFPCQALDAQEEEEELEQIAYLRRALAQARSERDQLLGAVERGETPRSARSFFSRGSMLK